VTRAHASSTIYLEVAAGVVTFILLGRYLEAGPAGPENSRSEFKFAAIRNALRAFLDGFPARLWPRRKFESEFFALRAQSRLDVEWEGFPGFFLTPPNSAFQARLRPTRIIFSEFLSALRAFSAVRISAVFTAVFARILFLHSSRLSVRNLELPRKVPGRVQTCK
ncbi:hypothetical protein, partial [Streptomyces sp. NPDC048659]|uniref:hypothetical protein n=1 Tax=Streptomyces sp. NPDC048659 TaxID=3155489 RepID=UPI0034414D05